MKLIICAKSDRGHFIGMPSAADYTVFSTDRAEKIRLGDLLSNPTWDDEDGLWISIQNLTTGEEIEIEIAAWSLTLDEAKELISKQDPDGKLAWHPPWPGKAG